MAETLLIRADADRTVGFGHMMRCLALAQGWRRDLGEAEFAATACDAHVRSRLEREGFTVHEISAARGSRADADAVRALQRRTGARFIAVDGYVFDADYQQGVKDPEGRVLVVDDAGDCAPFRCDVVLNHNINADASSYRGEAPGAQLLLGPRYFLLREEFRARRAAELDVSEVGRSLLVTIGGSALPRLYDSVVEAIELTEAADLEVVIIDASTLQETETSLPSGGVLRTIGATEDVPTLMARADIVIAGAGVTALECAYLGLPALLVTIADNQAGIAATLEEKGIAVDLGDGESVSAPRLAGVLDELLRNPDRRRQMATRGRREVDGYGPERVTMHLAGEQLWLRGAEPTDSDQLLEWINDPAARRASFRGGHIERETHEAWFAAKLRDAGAVIYLAFDHGDAPIGSCRFEMADRGRATISVVVDSRRRDRGLGTGLIRSAVRKFGRERGSVPVDAFIKPGNPASVRAFEKAGFAFAAAATVEEQEALRYETVS